MSAADGEEKFEQHGVLELMGHLRLAGRVSEQVIAGTALLRIDVPEVDGIPAYTRYFGGQAVYSFTPTSEAIAASLAKRLSARPIQPYELGRPAMLPLSGGGSDDDNPF